MILSMAGGWEGDGNRAAMRQIRSNETQSLGGGPKALPLLTFGVEFYALTKIVEFYDFKHGGRVGRRGGEGGKAPNLVQ